MKNVKEIIVWLALGLLIGWQVVEYRQESTNNKAVWEVIDSINDASEATSNLDSIQTQRIMELIESQGK